MADGGAGSPADAAARMLAGVSIYSPELGWAICARVAAGESLRAVCLSPGMPHRTTVRNWTETKPEFAQALAAAQRSRRVAWRMRDRARAAARRAQPPPAKGGRPCTYTREMGEEICWRLMNGDSLIAIARDPQMPCAGTIYGWLKRHPEFEDMYARARGFLADYLCDEVREVALDATPETVSADRLRFDALRWLTARLSPKKYAERLVIAAMLAQQRAEAAAEAEESGGGGRPDVIRFLCTSFERSPKDRNKVIAYPPRNAQEEADYIEAYGEAYCGPGALSPEEDVRLQTEHVARRKRVLRSLGKPSEWYEMDDDAGT
ncbi:hypothetical protein [Phenylobacterium sp.]|jgi:hypothetical protein|uniref:terminase small subunit-like protein n=1 Tax=Phenylobacterium sp. TaxID=1871053 RepID=UPI002F9285F1